jgi:hypothetical protein
MAGKKALILFDLVDKEAQKEFKRKDGPKDWEELRMNKTFWKPFQQRVIPLINKALDLPVTKSTGRSALHGAAMHLSGGVRKRKVGGGRKTKVEAHVPTKNETAAINSFLTGGGGKSVAFGRSML